MIIFRYEYVLDEDKVKPTLRQNKNISYLPGNDQTTNKINTSKTNR